MVKLIETTNVTINKQVTLTSHGNQTSDYHEIPAIGDGNCALNSISLWFIDHLLLLQEQNLALDINKRAIEKLIQDIKDQDSLGILRQRLNLYRSQASLISGNSYTDLANDLEDFIRFIEQPSITVGNFITYIQTNATSRQKIGALHVALAPGFRKLGVDLYVGQLQQRQLNTSEMVTDAFYLRQDGYAAGHEILTAIGAFFNINLIIFDQTTKKTPLPLTPNHAVATAHIYHTPGHFNYLAPTQRRGGIARVLSSPPVNTQPVTTVNNSSSTRRTPAPITTNTTATVSNPSANRNSATTNSNQVATNPPAAAKNTLTNTPATTTINNKKPTETDNLLLWEKEKIQHLTAQQAPFKHCATTQREIDEIVCVTQEINKKLVEPTATTQQATQEKLALLKQAAEQSSELVQAVKSKLIVTEDKINTLVRTKLEKDLLVGNFSRNQPTTIRNADEALARALQNEEILLFYNKNAFFFSTQQPTQAPAASATLSNSHNNPGGTLSS